MQGSECHRATDSKTVDKTVDKTVRLLIMCTVTVAAVPHGMHGSCIPGNAQPQTSALPQCAYPGCMLATGSRDAYKACH